jgi:hypothetical protein
MPRPREKTVDHNILRYLNGLPGCTAEKTHGGFYGRRAKSDIVGCINGRAFRFEDKAVGEDATQAQLLYLAKWERAGAMVAVLHSVEECRKVLQSYGIMVQ